MFYPPKQCLKQIEDKNNNRRAFDKSLCLFGANMTNFSCLLCSYLNCNIPLIKRILTFENIPKNLCVEEIAPNGKINKTLKPAAHKWFTGLMPMNIVQKKDDM